VQSQASSGIFVAPEVGQWSFSAWLYVPGPMNQRPPNTRVQRFVGFASSLAADAVLVLVAGSVLPGQHELLSSSE